VRSPALGRVARVRLLTPVGWRPSARRRWPVLYLLHGCCGSYQSWTRSTDIARWPALRSVLVVMPEGGDIGFYSDWRRHDPTALVRALAGVTLGIPVQADLYPGGTHSWPYWQRELHRALPTLLGAIRPRA
jgi:S-formylglutathione hydrolase FrmB